MNKDWLTLPSGIIVNLANVAYFAEADKPKRVEVVFIATFSVDNAQAMHLALTEEDTKALISELEQRGIEVEQLAKKIGWM